MKQFQGSTQLLTILVLWLTWCALIQGQNQIDSLVFGITLACVLVTFLNVRQILILNWNLTKKMESDIGTAIAMISSPFFAGSAVIPSNQEGSFGLALMVLVSSTFMVGGIFWMAFTTETKRTT